MSPMMSAFANAEELRDIAQDAVFRAAAASELREQWAVTVHLETHHWEALRLFFAQSGAISSQQ